MHDYIRLAFNSIDLDNGTSCGSRIIPEEWNNKAILDECDRIIKCMVENDDLETFCNGEVEEVMKLTKKYNAKVLNILLDDYFEDWVN